MSELQLKITMGDIDVNLQGEGELVYKIFKELREDGLGALHTVHNHATKQVTTTPDDLTVASKELTVTPSQDKKVPKGRKKSGTKQPQLIKDLDLSGRGGEKALKVFLEEKRPKSNIEKTTVFIYYLQNLLQCEDITIDHVFTCYKNSGEKFPLNLQANLTDVSSSKYGYIETAGGKYTMSMAGMNFVEHDLPPKEK